MESYRDITNSKIREQNLFKTTELLEEKVRSRVSEFLNLSTMLKFEIEKRKQVEKLLHQKEQELELKSLKLKEADTALKVLFEHNGHEKDVLEEKIASNIKQFIFPYLEKLKLSNLDKQSYEYIKIIELNLNRIVTSSLNTVTSHYLNLTPTEIQVANLIKEGKTTKDISNLLNLSAKAIEYHRNNIRHKLGLKNIKKNLRDHLITIAN